MPPPARTTNMGTYSIPCRGCGKMIMWFSGGAAQACGKCLKYANHPGPVGYPSRWGNMIPVSSIASGEQILRIVNEVLIPDAVKVLRAHPELKGFKLTVTPILEGRGYIGWEST